MNMAAAGSTLVGPTAYRTVVIKSCHSSFPVSSSFSPITQRRSRILVTRNSANESSEATGTELESPVEALKRPSSLISALNAEKALRGIAITDADHYGRLGLAPTCSYDQVGIAFRNKVAQAMNDQGLPPEEVEKQIEFLKESHSILSTAEERRLYDWSLARNGNPDKYMWPYEVDTTPLSTDDPPPQEPEDVEPTKWVGYFILAWFLLSMVLLVVFNRS